MGLSRSFWLLAGVLWVVLLVVGWRALLRYQLTPGVVGQVPEQWPEDSDLAIGRDQPTLLLFAHRNCPCTRATLGELEYVLSNAAGRGRAIVVLLAPAGAALDRVGGNIEARARGLPRTEVVIDTDGIEARRFRVRTSGHVALYGSDGRLLFSGGITEGRGHAGDNTGRRAVLAHLLEQEKQREIAPVYGCSLFGEEGKMDDKD